MKTFFSPLVRPAAIVDKSELLAKSQLAEGGGGLAADVGVVAGSRETKVLFGGGAIAPGGEKESGVDVRDPEIRAQADGFQEFAKRFGAIPSLLEDTAFHVVGVR